MLLIYWKIFDLAYYMIWNKKVELIISDLNSNGKNNIFENCK